MKSTSYRVVVFSVIIILLGFFVILQMTPRSQVEGRWYTHEAVDKGARLFQQHCAGCHGAEAEGTREWKKTDSLGNYPPPPLNGTAHAWHHDISVFKRTIREGGASLGGTMPPFKDKLSESDMDAVIAYFQSKWSDEIYQLWEERNLGTRIPSLGSLNIDQLVSQNNRSNKNYLEPPVHLLRTELAQRDSLTIAGRPE